MTVEAPQTPLADAHTIEVCNECAAPIRYTGGKDKFQHAGSFTGGRPNHKPSATTLYLYLRFHPKMSRADWERLRGERDH